MAYDVTKSNGDRLTLVPDRELDETTSLKLLGKNYAGYGEVMAENLVWLLENFANDTAPSAALQGQLWYDTDADQLKLYTATSVTSDGWEPVNPPLVKIATKTDSSYTVVASDHGKYLRFSNAASVLLPNSSSVPVGTKVLIGRTGSGAVSIRNDGSSVVQPSNLDPIVIDSQWGRVEAIKTLHSGSTATWEVSGDIAQITYSISPSASSVNEGSTVAYTVTTANMGSGTLYWLIDGGTVSSADITGSMSGSVAISSDTGSFNVTLAADLASEGAETLIVKLYTDSGYTNLVSTASTVTVNDTSVPASPSPSPTPSPTPTPSPSNSESGGGGGGGGGGGTATLLVNGSAAATDTFGVGTTVTTVTVTGEPNDNISTVNVLPSITEYGSFTLGGDGTALVNILGAATWASTGTYTFTLTGNTSTGTATYTVTVTDTGVGIDLFRTLGGPGDQAASWDVVQP